MNGPDATPQESHGSGYRERVYASYVSRFKGRPAPEEELAALERRGRVFDHLLAPLMRDGPPRRLADLGCGSGELLHWARSRGVVEAEGVDRSAEQVAVARGRGLAVRHGDAESFLADRPGGFDALVLQDVLEHGSRDECFALLDLCHRALAPGGRIMVTTPNAAGWRPGPVTHGDITHETLFTPSTLRLVLHLCGFEGVIVREAPPPPVSTPARLRGWLWRALRLIPVVLDRVETGGTGDGIYTRVMVAEARKPS